MASNKLDLDDDQKFALMKFRRNISDVRLPHHTDQYLLRWLRARSWNPEAAEKMLRQSLEWRKQWDVDNVKEWDPPEPLKTYHPSGVCGYDKDGAPVVIIPFAGLDIIGMLRSLSRQDLIKMAMHILEKNMDLAAKTGANEVVVIFDMDNFNIRPYAWRPATEVVISLLQMYEANYPEILKCCYIINAPAIFAIAFSVVKKFLNEYTLAKIQIYKNDPKKWKKVLRENIDGNNLPKYYGGDLVDPDGNPKYTTKINQGGKIPKSYYTKNITTDQPKKEYTTATIKKGEKLTLDFIIAEEGCVLRWDFKTESHDIKFGITRIDESGTVTPALRHRRIAAHQVDETGILACQSPATYTVTFDNSYSLLRSKKIHYCVYVTNPANKIAADFEAASLAPSSEENDEQKKQVVPTSISCNSSNEHVSNAVVSAVN